MQDNAITVTADMVTNESFESTVNFGMVDGQYIVRVSNDRLQRTVGDALLTVGSGLTILPDSLPAGIINQPYSATLTPSGGTAPYTFSLESGSLPPGLALDSSGQLTGTPTLAGNYNFMVHLGDSSNENLSKSYSIKVDTGITVSYTDSDIDHVYFDGDAFSAIITVPGLDQIPDPLTVTGGVLTTPQGTAMDTRQPLFVGSPTVLSSDPVTP